ncbi:tRNA (N(6)-L-threonylcarbamoyladenosine(37)-C(2))-methylthiotransferase MtaB [Chloroflexota bacterium]
MKVVLDTLGCKLNQAETELLARRFTEAGHKLVPQVDEADIYILNTCTVTNITDAKSRYLLRLAHRRNPEALVVATGCYAQRDPQGLAQINGVDLVIGNDEKIDLLGLLPGISSSDNRSSASGNVPINKQFRFRTRAFIKVQDGCDSCCSYCVVPLVRASEESVPPDQVVAEVKQRVADGYKEVVLTGTKIGAYNYEGISLKGLLESILSQTDVPRLRLSSLQPREISLELLSLWHNSRLCSHFHLPLQSGNEQMLGLMRRRYSVSDYERAVSLIRVALPDVAVTTDIIVGFPGETEADFEDSYSFCRKIEFARIHVFPYSWRSGTEACQLPHHVSYKLKRQRSQKMLALHKECSKKFRQQFLGKTLLVLWEKRSDGVWSGLTNNYIRVYTKSDENINNKVLPVKLEEVYGDGVWGDNQVILPEVHATAF